jgi:ankyrin repeat protein
VEKIHHFTGKFFSLKIANCIASFLPNILLPSNKKGVDYTQIYYDVMTDNVSGIQFQIDEGVDVNQQISHPDYDGETPLHVAIKENKPDCMRLLLSNNADPTLLVYYDKAKPYDAYALADAIFKYKGVDLRGIFDEFDLSQFRKKSFYL